MVPLNCNMAEKYHVLSFQEERTRYGWVAVISTTPPHNYYFLKMLLSLYHFKKKIKIPRGMVIA
jgi:hypothetical protein